MVSALAAWLDRVQARPAVARDYADLMERLQRLETDGGAGFDPYRVQWRRDWLERVIENGFAEEVRAGRAFFPLLVRG